MSKIAGFIVFVSLLVSLPTIAQQSTQSPYSILGLGEMKFTGFNNHRSAGGTSISVKDPYSFTAKNPASYANMRLTGFVSGVSATVGTLNTTNLSSDVAFGNFDNFALVFPFSTKRNMALSFGTYQLSEVGYDIINRNAVDTPTNYTLFRGTGGLTRLYVGYGAELIENLRVGANFNYNFGSIDATKAKIYPETNDYFSFSDQTSVYYKGVDFDLGLQYDILQKDSLGNLAYTHTIGATFNTESNLSGSGFRYSESFFGTFFDQGQVIPIDTLFYDGNLTSSVTKPISFGVGYSFSKGDKFGFSLEAEMTKWSGLNNNLNNLPFFDGSKLAAGIRYIPNPDYATKGKYLQKVRYNAGFRHENLYYNFNNEQLTEIGISFGLGLPIVKTYREVETGVKKLIVSRINLFAEYSTRGTTDNGLIQEDYFTLGIGLNLNDKWFQKNKYR